MMTNQNTMFQNPIQNPLRARIQIILQVVPAMIALKIRNLDQLAHLLPSSQPHLGLVDHHISPLAQPAHRGLLSLLQVLAVQVPPIILVQVITMIYRPLIWD